MEILVAIQLIDPSVIPCARNETESGSTGLWVVLRPFVGLAEAVSRDKTDTAIAQKVREYFCLPMENNLRFCTTPNLTYRLLDRTALRDYWCLGAIPFWPGTCFEITYGIANTRTVSIGDPKPDALNVTGRWGQIAAINDLDFHFGLSEQSREDRIAATANIEQTHIAEIRRWLLDVVDRLGTKSSDAVPPHATENDTCVIYNESAGDFAIPARDLLVPLPSVRNGDPFAADLFGATERDFVKFWRSERGAPLRQLYCGWIGGDVDLLAELAGWKSESNERWAQLQRGPRPPVFRYTARELCGSTSPFASKQPTNHDTYAEHFHLQWRDVFKRATTCDAQVTAYQELAWALMTGERLYWPEDSTSETLLWLPGLLPDDKSADNAGATTDRPPVANVVCSSTDRYQWTHTLSLLGCTHKVADDWPVDRAQLQIAVNGEPLIKDQPLRDFSQYVRDYRDEVEKFKAMADRGAQVRQVRLPGSRHQALPDIASTGYVLWSPPYKQLDLDARPGPQIGGKDTRLHVVPVPCLDLLENKPAAYLPAPDAEDKTPAFVSLTPQRLLIRHGGDLSTSEILPPSNLFQRGSRFRHAVLLQVQVSEVGFADDIGSGNGESAKLRLFLLSGFERPDKVRVFRFLLNGSDGKGSQYDDADLALASERLGAINHGYVRTANAEGGEPTDWVRLESERVCVHAPAVYWVSTDENQARAFTTGSSAELLIVAGEDESAGPFNAVVQMLDKKSDAPAQVVLAPNRFFEFRFGHSTENIFLSIEYRRSEPTIKVPRPVDNMRRPPAAARAYDDKPLLHVWKQISNTAKGWLWLQSERGDRVEIQRLTTMGHLRPLYLGDSEDEGCAQGREHEAALPSEQVHYFAFGESFEARSSDRNDLEDTRVDERDLPESRRFELWCGAGSRNYTLILGLDHQLGFRNFYPMRPDLLLRTASPVKHPADVRCRGEECQPPDGPERTDRHDEEKGADPKQSIADLLSWRLTENNTTVEVILSFQAASSLFEANAAGDERLLIAERGSALRPIYEALLDLLNPGVEWGACTLMLEAWQYDFGRCKSDQVGAACAERRSTSLSALLVRRDMTPVKLGWNVSAHSEIEDLLHAHGAGTDRPHLLSFVTALRQLASRGAELTWTVPDEVSDDIRALISMSDVVRVGLRISRSKDRVWCIGSKNECAGTASDLEPLMRAIPFQVKDNEDVVGLPAELLSTAGNPTGAHGLPVVALANAAGAFPKQAAARLCRYLDCGDTADTSPSTAFRWLRRAYKQRACVECEAHDGLEADTDARTRQLRVNMIAAAVTGAGDAFSVIRAGRELLPTPSAPPEALGQAAWFYTFPWALAPTPAWPGLEDQRSTQEFLAFLLKLLEQLCRGYGSDLELMTAMPTLSQAGGDESQLAGLVKTETENAVSAMLDARDLRAQVAETLANNFLSLVEDAEGEATYDGWNAHPDDDEEMVTASRNLLGRIEPFRNALMEPVRAIVQDRLAHDLSFATAAKAFAVHVVELSGDAARRITAVQIEKTIARPDGNSAAMANENDTNNGLGPNTSWIVRLQKRREKQTDAQSWRFDVDRFSFSEFFALQAPAGQHGPGGLVAAVVDVLDDATYDNDFEIYHANCRVQTFDDLLNGHSQVSRPIVPVHHNPEWRTWRLDEDSGRKVVDGARYLLPSRLAPTVPVLLQHVTGAESTPYYLVRKDGGFDQTGDLGNVPLDKKWSYASPIQLAEPSSRPGNDLTKGTWQLLSSWTSNGLTADQAKRLDCYVQHVSFAITGDEEAPAGGRSELTGVDSDRPKLFESLRNDVFVVELDELDPGTNDQVAAGDACTDGSQNSIFASTSMLATWYRYLRSEAHKGVAKQPMPASLEMKQIQAELWKYLTTKQPEDAAWFLLTPPKKPDQNACTPPTSDPMLFALNPIDPTNILPSPATLTGQRVVGVALYQRSPTARGEAQQAKANDTENRHQLALRVSFVGSSFKRYRLRVAVLRNTRDADLDGDADINPIFTMQTRSQWITLPQVVIQYEAEDAAVLKGDSLAASADLVVGATIVRLLADNKAYWRLLGPRYNDWRSEGTLVGPQGFGDLVPRISLERFQFPESGIANTEMRAFRYALQPDFMRATPGGLGAIPLQPQPRLVGVGRTPQSRQRDPTKLGLQSLFNSPGSVADAFRQCVSLEWRVNGQEVLQIKGWRIEWQDESKQ